MDPPAQLYNSVRNLSTLCPIKLPCKTERFILEGNLRADSADASDAIGLPEPGELFLGQIVGGSEVDHISEQCHQCFPLLLRNFLIRQNHMEQAVDLIKGISTGQKVVGIDPGLERHDLPVTQFTVCQKTVEHSGQKLNGGGDHVVVGIVICKVIA